MTKLEAGVWRKWALEDTTMFSGISGGDCAPSSGSIKVIMIGHVSDQMQVSGGACNELEPLRFPAPLQCQLMLLEHLLPLGTAVGGSC